MNITEHTQHGLKRSYHVSFPAEVVALSYAQKYGELSKTAKISGFRPGKVPQHLLKQHYHERVKQDVLKDLMERGAQGAVERVQRRTVETPRIELQNEGENQELSFLVHMELFPEVTLQPWDALVSERMTYEVTSDDIEAELRSIGHYFREWTSAAQGHKATLGDQALLRIKGSIGNKPLGFQDQDYTLELGQGLVVPEGYPIPGFDEALVGHQAGDAYEYTLSLPQNDRFKDWAGQEAVFHVSVSDLKVPCPLEINDTFAQNRGFNTLVELREAVRHQLQKESDERTFLHVKRHLLDALAKQYQDVPVPESLARQEFNHIWAEFNRHLQTSGESIEHSEEVQKEYYQIAERRIRLGLILSEIGQKNDISVSTDELRQALLEITRQYPGHESEVIKFYQKNAQAMQSVQAPLFENKVVRFILAQNKIKVRKVTQEELTQAEEVLENQSSSAAPKKSSKPKSKAAPQKDEGVSSKEKTSRKAKV